MVAEDNILYLMQVIVSLGGLVVKHGLDWNRPDSWNVDWNRHLVPETSLELIELSSINKVSLGFLL
jgi:hypothetical protein